jgi:hypothetical protein
MVLGPALFGLAPAPRVEVPAIDECPARERVLDAVETLADGRAPAVALVVERTAAGFAGRISVGTEDGSARVRELSTQTCTAAVEGALAILAVALGDDGVPSDAPPTSPSNSRSSSPPELARDLEPTRGTTPRGTIAERRMPGWSIGARVGFGHGPLPRPSATVGLTLAAVGARWSAGVQADLWTPQRASIDGASARFLMVTGGPRVCHILRAARVELPTCGFGSFGVARGVARDDRFTRDPAVSPWAAVGAGVGVRVPLGARVALGFGLDSQWSFTRPRLGLPTIGPVCCQRFAVQALAGVELRAAPRPAAAR